MDDCSGLDPSSYVDRLQGFILKIEDKLKDFKVNLISKI